MAIIAGAGGSDWGRSGAKSTLGSGDETFGPGGGIFGSGETTVAGSTFRVSGVDLTSAAIGSGVSGLTAIIGFIGNNGVAGVVDKIGICIAGLETSGGGGIIPWL